MTWDETWVTWDKLVGLSHDNYGVIAPHTNQTKNFFKSYKFVPMYLLLVRLVRMLVYKFKINKMKSLILIKSEILQNNAIKCSIHVVAALTLFKLYRS